MGQTGRLTELSSSVNICLTLVMTFAFFRGSTSGDLSMRTHYWAGEPYSGVCDAEFLGMPTDVRVLSVEVFLQGRSRVYTLTTYTVYKSDKVNSWQFIPSGYWYYDYHEDYIQPFKLDIEIPEVTADYQITCQVTFTDKTGHTATALKRRELVHLVVHPRGDDNPCKDGWMYFEEVDQCLKVFHATKSWGDAQRYCKSTHKGDLAVIGGKEFDDELTGMTGIKRGSAHWIGLSAKENFYEWVTTDFSPIFRNWGDGTPVSYGTMCVEKGMKGNGTWSLRNCTAAYRFFCLRSKDAESEPESLFSPTVTYVLLVILVTVLMAAIILCALFGIFLKSSRQQKRGFLEPVRKLVEKPRRKASSRVDDDGAETSDTSTAAQEEYGRPATSGHVVVLFDSVLNDVVESDNRKRGS